MKEFIKKLIRLETTVASEKGPFDLFGLFSTDEEEDDRWDLVVSATWIGEESLQALEYLTKQLRSHLTTGEFSRILKIAPLDVYDPRVIDIQKIVTTEHKVKELSNYQFYGFRVEKLYVITCKLQIDEHLMRLMWKSILRMWRSGRGMIESEAVLEELEKRGEQVRDYAMDRVFEYLLRTGCITGAQYIDSDGIKKHGAMSIGWVNSSCRIPDSIPMSA
jgi:hypothetical protein